MSNTYLLNKKEGTKRQKIRQMTKEDKKIIMNLIKEPSQWIKDLSTIDSETISRSLDHILNQSCDYVPNELIMSNYKLKEIYDMKQKITINDVLISTNTLFRFAPSPSGYLHVGHIVPILMNILLRQISRNSGKKSELIIRIDDTNPDPHEDDFTEQIINTTNKIMGDEKNDYTSYRSSSKIPLIIDLVDKSFENMTDKFYVDLSNQDTIQKERATRTENKYRKMLPMEQVNLWKQVKQGEMKEAVVRAKIDISSNNGNLRDPVMFRWILNKLMPTYDIVCPVLDSLDSMDSMDSMNSKSTMTMIALRDGNYYDRMEQYYWIQSALNLKPTIMITFSRVNFEGVVLSKRKIKQLISEGLVDSWTDPRLMTIDGAFNRGITLGGLLNFFWLSCHMSVEKRVTCQHLDTLFAANDKVLSQVETFIVDRMPVSHSHKCDDVQLIKLIIKKIVHVADPPELNNFLPKIVKIQDLYCFKNKLITHNMVFLNVLLSNNPGMSLDDGPEIINRLKLDHKFKTADQINVGDIVKLNNYKNLPFEQVFGGFYIVMSKINPCSETPIKILELIHIA